MELEENKKSYISLSRLLWTNVKRSVVCMRYGLHGKEEITQREIADRMGTSRSYVSRIEKAISKLRACYCQKSNHFEIF